MSGYKHIELSLGGGMEEDEYHDDPAVIGAESEARFTPSLRSTLADRWAEFSGFLRRCDGWTLRYGRVISCRKGN